MQRFFTSLAGIGCTATRYLGSASEMHKQSVWFGALELCACAKAESEHEATKHLWNTALDLVNNWNAFSLYKCPDTCEECCYGEFLASRQRADTRVNNYSSDIHMQKHSFSVITEVSSLAVKADFSLHCAFLKWHLTQLEWCEDTRYTLFCLYLHIFVLIYSS